MEVGPCSKGKINKMDFVDISILCPKCNEWAIDNANYCHKCGRKLYPCICSKGQEILNKVINNYAESILKRFNILFGGDLIIKKDKNEKEEIA